MSTDRYIERVTSREAAVRRPATIREVAALAGVSVSTVSNALAGRRSVSGESSARVRAAVHRLGYRPDGAARAARAQTRQAIGLVVPDSRNPFFAEVAHGVEAVAQSLGWAVFLASTDLDEAREADYLDRMAGAADGVLVCSTSGSPDQVQRMVDSGIAVVACDERVAVTGAGGVFSDDTAAGRIAARHILTRAPRRIAMICGPEHLATARARRTGFRDELQAAGRSLPPWRSLASDYTIDGGRWAADQILASDPRVDAVFCANDLQAVGAAQALRQAGRQVPADVIVIGIDGIAWGEVTEPSLTSVTRDPHRLGSEAARLLIQMVGEGAQPREIVLPVALVERDSTRRSGGD
ncbi:LacI family DNA-binding transcriptional regulator [Frankia sp. EI5c]|uniref:LacI family DNA-binding transcriptional regulator n=1 Tax=Frankia sp. EI5c TaxID=683316 RepID=UPI001F5BF26D|nr:LacI family DNA-binding transcriptional regulator [Frankia sp. EI5c]